MITKTDSPQAVAAQQVPSAQAEAHSAEPNTAPRQANFHAREPYQGPERRAVPRVVVDHPAVLRTPVRQWPVRIVDISGAGAKLVMQSPPRVGAQAFMQCDNHEVFCKVVWVSDCSCSIEFDRPASPELLATVGGAAAVATQVVANPLKIPLGQKRGRTGLA